MMSKTISLPVNQALPPVVPPVPQIPPLNTVTGVLQSQGQMILVSGQPPGDPFNYEVAQNRFEYVTNFMAGNDFSDRVINVPTFSYEFLTPINENILPLRSLAYLSCVSAQISQKLYFLAIKPPNTVGILRVSYTPNVNLSNDDTDTQRAAMDYWDVGKSSTHEMVIPLPSNAIYRGTLKNMYNPIYTNDSLIGVMSASDFQLYPGAIKIAKQTTYQPGSLFPVNFPIYVFSQIIINGKHARLPSVYDLQFINT